MHDVQYCKVEINVMLKAFRIISPFHQSYQSNAESLNQSLSIYILALQISPKSSWKDLSYNLNISLIKSSLILRTEKSENLPHQ